MTEQATPPVPPDGSPPPSAPDDADAGALAPRLPVPEGGAAPAAPALPPWRRFVFLGVLASVSLALDLGTKVWAKDQLEGHRRVEFLTDHVYFTFARNRGGAWGLLQDEPESVRRPFFVVISVLAIVFIVSLYRRLTPQQWALRWGLPLVLGGALGNLINRIQYNFVVDFIDVRAACIGWLNGIFSSAPTDHWPTFNIADVAIVAGVGLMGIDMFTTRKTTPAPAVTPAAPAAPRPDEPGPASAPEPEPAVIDGGSPPKPLIDGGSPEPPAPVEP
jgi:signal peptidase II